MFYFNFYIYYQLTNNCAYVWQSIWHSKNKPEVVAAVTVEKFPEDSRRKQSWFATWAYDLNLL